MLRRWAVRVHCPSSLPSPVCYAKEGGLRNLPYSSQINQVQEQKRGKRSWCELLGERHVRPCASVSYSNPSPIGFVSGN